MRNTNPFPSRRNKLTTLAEIEAMRIVHTGDHVTCGDMHEPKLEQVPPFDALAAAVSKFDRAYPSGFSATWNGSQWPCPTDKDTAALTTCLGKHGKLITVGDWVQIVCDETEPPMKVIRVKDAKTIRLRAKNGAEWDAPATAYIRTTETPNSPNPKRFDVKYTSLQEAIAAAMAAPPLRDKSHDKHVAAFSRYLASPEAKNEPENKFQSVFTTHKRLLNTQGVAL